MKVSYLFYVDLYAEEIWKLSSLIILHHLNRIPSQNKNLFFPTILSPSETCDPTRRVQYVLIQYVHRKLRVLHRLLLLVYQNYCQQHKYLKKKGNNYQVWGLKGPAEAAKGCLLLWDLEKGGNTATICLV